MIRFLLTSSLLAWKRKGKQLHFVCFANRSRTHSFNANSWQTLGLGFISLAVMIWAIVSAFVIGELQSENEDMKSELLQNKKEIFRMQVRYEGVFEQVYDPKSLAFFETDRTASKLDMKPTLDDFIAGLNHTIGFEQSVPEQTKVDQPVLELAKKPIIKKTANKLPASPVKLAGSIDKKDTGDLVINYKVSNLNAPRVQKGYVSVVASYRDDSGQVKGIVIPRSVKLAQSSLEPQMIKKGYSFKIRNFKSGKIIIPSENFHPHKLEKVEIFAANRKGDIVDKREFQISDSLVSTGKSKVKLASNLRASH